MSWLVIDMAMTHTQAKKLLTPGDEVYIVDASIIEPVKIKQIHLNCVSVMGGYLYFDDVGDEWFLTKHCAKLKAKGEQK